MSVGPLGALAGSVAGAPLAQAKGSDVERTSNDTGNQQRRVDADQKAENAAGIGAADGEDHETAERDADGRRLWEDTRRRSGGDSADAPSQAPEGPKGNDPTGQSGTLLDLSG